MTEAQNISVAFSAERVARAAAGLFLGMMNDPDLEAKARHKVKAMCESGHHDVEGVIVTTIASLMYLIVMEQAVSGDGGEA